MVTEKDLIEAKARYKNVYTNPLTPLNFLKRAELIFPNKTAVVDKESHYTWKEFARRVYRLANALIAKGLIKDDRVAILSRNNSAMLESFYGIGLAGGVSVPINYRLAAKEVAYIINHCEAKVLIFEHAYADDIAEVKSDLKTVQVFVEIPAFGVDEVTCGESYDKLLAAASSKPLPVPVEDENDMLSIVYTSGTTGTPKGCVHSHRGAYLNSLGEVIAAHLNHESSYLWTLPMFHCDGWNFVWAVTAVGAKHVCLDVVRPEIAYQLMVDEKVTNMCAAPTVYLALAEYMKKNYYKFECSVYGFIAGAAPSPLVISEAEFIGIDIQHVYGLSEVYGPHTICEWNAEWDCLPLAKKARLKARQGVPYVTWTEVRVVDDDMNDTPKDGLTQGEIVMRGNNVMQWYFKEHDRTEKAFRGGWFHSGDAAVMHPDNYIEIVDRLKDLINTGGEKVSSVEVERVISEHPAVFDVAVFGVPDPKWGEVVKAMIQLRSSESLTREEVTEWCRDRLAHFKAPRIIEFGEVPRTTTGKINKNILRSQISATK